MASRQLAMDVKDAIEDMLERNLSPKKLRRYLEFLGPALLVITYIEDSHRIVTRWAEQMLYMATHMRWGRALASIILMISVLAQLGGSVGVIVRKQVKASCYVLLVFTGAERSPAPGQEGLRSLAPAVVFRRPAAHCLRPAPGP